MPQKSKRKTKAQKTKAVDEALMMMGREKGDVTLNFHRMVLFESNQQRLVFIISLLCCCCFLGMTLYLGYQYNQTKNEQEKTAFEQARRGAFQVALKINRELNETMLLARGIANELTSGKLSNENLAQRIRDESNKKPNIFGLGAAFEPEEYKPGTKLFAPYYKKDEFGDFKRYPIEDIYDYTDSKLSEAEWYTSALHQNGGWMEPFLGEVAKTHIAEYSVPFYRFDSNKFQYMPIGLIYVDHSPETLAEFVKSLNLGESGYSYILSKEGRFISHPDKKYLGQTISEVVADNKVLQDDGERALAGEIFYRDDIDPDTGQESWVFYEPVPIAGWSIGIVFNKNLLNVDASKRNLIQIALSGTCFLFFLSILVLRAYNGGVYKLWTVSLFTAFLFFAVIGWIWYIEIIYPPSNQQEIVLANSSRLEAELTGIDNNLKQEGIEKYIEVPTGIMLETIGFAGANENSVSGYIWQKYSPDVPEDAREMPLLTDTVDDVGPYTEEIYRFQEGEEETIGWFFRSTLRQEPSVDKYPLDQATVQLQIWPHSLDENIVLVPDLDSYEFVEPTKKPGLAEAMVLEDWYILRSYFSYRFDKYNTDFGGNQTIKKHRIPDLYYNVIIRRSILSPIVAHAVTIMVIISLMFAVLLVHAENSFNVLSYAAALFFVVAVSHVGLRSELQASGVVYLEYAYILSYLILLIVSVNAMLFYSEVTIRFIQFGDNLYPKLLYWPVVVGAFLAITLVVFYPTSSGEPTPETVEAPTVVDTVEARPVIQAEQTTVEVETRKVITDGLITLRYNLSEPIHMLDPSLIERAEDDAQIRNLFIGLIETDPQSSLILPSLATDWTSSEDGDEWTFMLRDDVAWVEYDPQTAQVTQATDFKGKPRFVTAHDVVGTIKRLLSSDNPTASMLYIIKNAQAVHTGGMEAAELGVEALDDWTVKFSLEHPAAYFPAILSHPRTYPVPSWTISEWDDDWTKAGIINTNGPYLLSQWQDGERILFVKNPLWVFDKQVQIERIEQTVVADMATALDMYQDNKFDTLPEPMAEIEQIQNNIQLKQELGINYTFCTDYLGFMHPKAPFNDPRVRQAFSAAIDREVLVNRELGDLPAATFAPPGIFGAPSAKRHGRSYDPEFAKTVLQQYLDDRGLPLNEFNEIYDIILDQDNETMRVIQKMWQETLGVEVKLEEKEWDYNHSSSLEDVPHIFSATHCATYPDEHNFVHEIFNAQQGTNYVRRNCDDPTCQQISATDFDKLTNNAAETVDSRERFDLYAQAEQILAVDEAAYAPLSHRGNVALTKPWLTRNYPADKRLDFYNWSIDTEMKE
ncbi:ABC transporter substrate-binding protein [Anaerolineales bacterium HSG6]|nr:ABC transporter substrate-binding protein [Anaerolineales bacterium HSG6]